ncbi:MAG: hypothetical protein ABI286_01990 [Edaphobacter sp.]
MIGAKLALWKPVLILVALSIAAFFPFLMVGISHDCKPGQSDGQCGLSTFVGAINGFAAAGVILIGGGIYLTILHFQKKKKAGTLQNVPLDKNEGN